VGRLRAQDRRRACVSLAGAAPHGCFDDRIALALRGARVGIWLLVALFAIGAATVNPIQHGLDALLESPAARLGRELRARPDTGAVLNFWAGDISVRGGLTASGVDLVSGVNLYPNEKAWHVLDPDDSQRQGWDRYNNAIWSPGPPGSDPQIVVGSEDTVAVTVDPCDRRLAKLGVGTIVSIVPLTVSVWLRQIVSPAREARASTPTGFVVDSEHRQAMKFTWSSSRPGMPMRGATPGTAGGTARASVGHRLSHRDGPQPVTTAG
jgi:hypothetical protein